MYRAPIYHDNITIRQHTIASEEEHYPHTVLSSAGRPVAVLMVVLLPSLTRSVLNGGFGGREERRARNERRTRGKKNLPAHGRCTCEKGGAVGRWTG